MIDTSTVIAEDPFQWGPIIVAMLTAFLLAAGWAIRKIVGLLNLHTTQLAVIENKTETNANDVKSVNSRVENLWTYVSEENTITRRRVKKEINNNDND